MPIPLLTILALACSHGVSDGPSDSGGLEESGPDDTSDDTEIPADELPTDPTPFVITVTGDGAPLELSFDEPQCNWLLGSTNFRQMWRDAADDHVFVLVLEVLGTFSGAGVYDESIGANVRLQEEAGGDLRSWSTDEGQGDAATVTVDFVDTDASLAWGDATFTGLHSSTGGAVTVSPLPVPIWCPELN